MNQKFDAHIIPMSQSHPPNLYQASSSYVGAWQRPLKYAWLKGNSHADF